MVTREVAYAAAMKIIGGFHRDWPEVPLARLLAKSEVMHDYEDANMRFAPIIARTLGLTQRQFVKRLFDDATTQAWNAVIEQFPTAVAEIMRRAAPAASYVVRPCDDDKGRTWDVCRKSDGAAVAQCFATRAAARDAAKVLAGGKP